MPNRLSVLAWNVFEGHNPKDVRAQLSAMIHAHSPDVIVLSEAIRQHGELTGLGYRVVQLAPKAKRKGNKSEDADIAILIRHGVVPVYRGSMLMSEFWKGPKHGLPHDPRVYRKVRVEKNGHKWRIAGAHVPFGKAAVAETVSRLTQWLKATNTPTILVGDMNMRSREMSDRIATPADAKVAGYRIDLASYRHCKVVETTPLGLHGSDHNAVFYVFEAGVS